MVKGPGIVTLIRRAVTLLGLAATIDRRPGPVEV